MENHYLDQAWVYGKNHIIIHAINFKNFVGIFGAMGELEAYKRTFHNNKTFRRSYCYRSMLHNYSLS